MNKLLENSEKKPGIRIENVNTLFKIEKKKFKEILLDKLDEFAIEICKNYENKTFDELYYRTTRINALIQEYNKSFSFYVEDNRSMLVNRGYMYPEVLPVSYNYSYRRILAEKLDELAEEICKNCDKRTFDEIDHRIICIFNLIKGYDRYV